MIDKPLLLAGLGYAGGALITLTWLVLAMRRNPELRTRHNDVALAFGWPLVVATTAFCWPVIVLRVAVWGEPTDENS